MPPPAAALLAKYRPDGGQRIIGGSGACASGGRRWRKRAADLAVARSHVAGIGGSGGREPAS